MIEIDCIPYYGILISCPPGCWGEEEKKFQIKNRNTIYKYESLCYDFFGGGSNSNLYFNSILEDVTRGNYEVKMSHDDMIEFILSMEGITAPKIIKDFKNFAENKRNDEVVEKEE